MGGHTCGERRRQTVIFAGWERQPRWKNMCLVLWLTQVLTWRRTPGTNGKKTLKNKKIGTAIVTDFIFGQQIYVKNSWIGKRQLFFVSSKSDLKKGLKILKNAVQKYKKIIIIMSKTSSRNSKSN